MRIFVVLILILSSIPAFAVDFPTRINDAVTVSKAVNPDIMKSNFSVTYTDDNFQSAASGIEKIAAVIKAHSDTCTFTSYFINPRYRYINNERKLEGFQANLSSPCSFKDTVEFDAVLNDVVSVTNSNKTYVTSVSPIKWVVSDKLNADTKDSLKSEVISVIDDKREIYSNATRKTCYTSEITFEGAAQPVDHPMLARSMTAEAISSTPPDQVSEGISVNADFTLICK